MRLDDLAVRKAFEHYFGDGKAMDEETVRRRGEEWGEHQNLAVHCLLAGHRAERAVGYRPPG